MPPKDLAILRAKLRGAARDPNFSPASLLQDGCALLDKADKIQGFLKQQRNRTEAKSTKTEWLLTQRQLEEERDGLDKDLVSCLVQLSASSGRELPEVDVCLQQLHAVAAGNRAHSADIRDQVRRLSSAVRGLQSRAARDLKRNGEELRGKLDSLAEDLQLQGEAEARSVSELTADVRSCWPSAMTNESTSYYLAITAPSASTPSATVSKRNSFSNDDLGAASALQGSDLTGQPSLSAECSKLSNHGGIANGSTASTSLAARYDLSSDTEELEAQLADYPGASSDLVGRLRAVFTALQDKFVERLETWRMEHEMSRVGPSTSSGGWTPDEHSMFLKLRDRYSRPVAGAAGKPPLPRESIMHKVAALMPPHTVQDVMQHDEWWVAHRQMHRRCRDIVDGWMRDRRQFLEDAQHFLKQSQDLNDARAEAAAERAAYEVERARVREGQGALYAAKAEAMAAEEQLRAKQALVAAQEVADADRRRQAEITQNKEMIAEYRRELELQRQEEAEQAAAAAEEAARQAAALAPYHKERVDLRAAEVAAKHERAKDQVRQREEEQRQRTERLARLAALVAPSHIEADPLRVLQPTAASSAMPEEFGEAAFHPVHGYTTAQITRDQRFKVMEALASRGLVGTTYGRQVIAAAPTAKPTRPDNLTHVQRGL